MRYFITFIAFTCMVLAPASSRAEDTLPENFFEVEGAGLYATQKDGSLGDGVWNGSKRADVTRLIEILPVASESYTVHKLIDAALLGASNTQALEGAEEDIVLGQDLLTLRLNALIRAGRYKTALEFYNLAAGKTPYHPMLAKAGILSMLGSGEKSLACVESKVYDNQEIDTAFWDSVRAYCAVSLSEDVKPADALATLEQNSNVLLSSARDADYTFPYSAEALNNLSRIELAALIADQRISASGLTPAQIALLPPAHTVALLAAKDLSGQDLLLLSIRAAELGIIKPDDLAPLYKTHEDKTLALPRLYHALTEAEADSEKVALLSEVLDLEKEYGVTALLPFAKFIQKVILPAPNLEQMDVITKILHRINNSIPPELVANFLQNLPENDENIQKSIVFHKIYLLQNDRKSDELSMIVQENGILVGNPHFLFKNVIENLDKPLSDVDNAAIVYEKDFFLTSQTQHEMPTQKLWNRFNAVGDKELLGETVLLSAYVLRDQTPNQIYGGLFRDIVKNLNSVGLTYISRDLALEGLITGD